MEKLSPLASVSATQQVLEQFGLNTKKALGQHFLINDGVVRKICDLADLNPQDDVLEVGPGIGTLTVALLQLAGRVVAIERDTDLPAVLEQTCEPWSDTFTLISGDALEVAPEDLPFAPHKFVANLPYAVAATIVLDYFERYPSLQTATVMVQAEVAARMAAKPSAKDYGAYTAKLALLAHSAGQFGVSESNFFPPPRVKSTVIKLERNAESIEKPLMEATFTMADAAFATRRKTIANSMKTYFKAHPEKFDSGNVDALLERAGIDPRVRAEALEPTAFITLAQASL